MSSAAGAKLWYPHYIEKYRRKTGHLTIAEHGAYRLLMDAYWDRRGALPADETRLRKLIGADAEEWAAVRDAVLAFFTLTPEGYVHDKIEEQMREADAKYSAKVARVTAARAARAVKPENGDDKKPEVRKDISSDIKPDNGATYTYTNTVSKDTQEGGRASAPSVEKPKPVLRGEEFWKAYPHPPNPGGKRPVVEKINRLPEAEQALAIRSLARLRAAIDDQRKRIPDYQPPMASTYVNQRRWEGFEPKGEELPLEPISAHPDASLGQQWASLRAAIGDEAIRTWFMCRDGPALRRSGEGFAILAEGVRAERIAVQYSGRLDAILGRKKWRIEAPPPEKPDKKSENVSRETLMERT